MARVACDSVVTQTVTVGAQYALSVMFSLRLVGTTLADVPRRSGVAAPPSDVLQFLLGLDAASAFNVSTSDVRVRTVPHYRVYV